MHAKSQTGSVPLGSHPIIVTGLNAHKFENRRNTIPRKSNFNHWQSFVVTERTRVRITMADRLHDKMTKFFSIAIVRKAGVL